MLHWKGLRSRPLGASATGGARCSSAITLTRNLTPNSEP
jgi:hypothetical protein